MGLPDPDVVLQHVRRAKSGAIESPDGTTASETDADVVDVPLLSGQAPGTCCCCCSCCLFCCRLFCCRLYAVIICCRLVGCLFHWVFWAGAAAHLARCDDCGSGNVIAARTGRVVQSHSSRHVPRVSPRHVILSSLAFVVVSAVVVWLSVSWAAAFIWFLLGYFIVVVRTLATPAADVVDTCVCADF